MGGNLQLHCGGLDIIVFVCSNVAPVFTCVNLQRALRHKSAKYVWEENPWNVQGMISLVLKAVEYRQTISCLLLSQQWWPRLQNTQKCFGEGVSVTFKLFESDPSIEIEVERRHFCFFGSTNNFCIYEIGVGVTTHHHFLLTPTTNRLLMSTTTICYWCYRCKTEICVIQNMLMTN